MPEHADEEIAAQVQRGDKEAFRALIERYEPKIMRYARRFLLGPDDADDLVQDAFLKAYMNIQSFDVSRRFSPWLYRIAHNEFITALRKRSASPFIPSLDFDTILPTLHAAETADGNIHREELRAALDRGLAGIDPKYREPLVLFYYEELSYQEIADVLKVPLPTVGVRLARGRTQLKKVLAEKHNL